MSSANILWDWNYHIENGYYLWVVLHGMKLCTLIQQEDNVKITKLKGKIVKE
jgi:hypothetical protein